MDVPVSMAATASIIFLHGSGDTGTGFRSYLEQVWSGSLLKRALAANVSLHFPTATPRPYKLAGNQVMNVWFDRHGLEPQAPEHTESIEESCREIETLIDGIIASGIPADKIALGGFSMGGGLALQCMLRTKHRLGACFALSSFMCAQAAIYSRPEEVVLASASPIFMRHGAADGFILPSWGSETAEKLATVGMEVDFGLVPHLQHALEDDEIASLTDWLWVKLRLDASCASPSVDVN